MSEVLTSPIYMVRLPKGFAHLFNSYDDKVVPLAAVGNLRQLANHLSLEDVFYFVYEQTSDNTFATFTSLYGITPLLRQPDNIAWLTEVQKEYDAYVRRRKELEKINPIQVNSSREFFNCYKLSLLPITGNGARSMLDGYFILATDIEENDSSTPTERRLEFIPTLMKAVGYDIFRRLPITKAILAQ